MQQGFIFLFIFMFWLNQASAASISPFYSKEQKLTSFSYTDRDYEDIRIDFNQDKKIDFWKIKKSSIVIRVSFLNDRVIYHIRDIKGNLVSERILISMNEKLYLYYSKDRKQRVYNLENTSLMCPDNHKTEWAKLKELFSTVRDSTLGTCADNYLDNSCKVDSTTSDFIVEALLEVYSPPYRSASSENKLLNCIESPSALQLFEKRYGKDIGSQEHNSVVAEYKNKIIKFLEYANGDQKPIISCKENPESKNLAMASELGNIQIILPKQNASSAEKPTALDFKKKIFHESIHTSSVEDEDMTKALTDLCIGNIEPNKINLQPISITMGTKSMFPTVLDAEQSAARASVGSLEAIPASVAENPKPLPSHSSPADMNRLAESGGTQQVAEVSRTQTSGVIRMAENVLAPTPAIAATPSNNLAATETASPSTSSSSSNYSSPSYETASVSSATARSNSSKPAESSSRAPASEYQLDMSTVSAKAPVVSLPSSASKTDTIARGEFVREEIDLTKPNSPSSAPSPQTRAPASAQAAPTGPSATPAIQNGNSEVTSSGGGLNSASSNQTSASLGSESLSSNESRQASPARRASASSGSAGPYVPSRDEVVSFIAGGSYQQARGKLKDETFVQTLRQNSITVYDLGGNTYGATKGEVIFVDQGDRFVRQK